MTCVEVEVWLGADPWKVVWINVDGGRQELVCIGFDGAMEALCHIRSVWYDLIFRIWIQQGSRINWMDQLRGPVLNYPGVGV